LIHELDLQDKLKMFLRTFVGKKNDALLTHAVLAEHVNTVLVPELAAANDERVPVKQKLKFLSERQAGRWLSKLGWVRSEHKKNVYVDGHDRPDVKRYNHEFSLRMLARYPKMDQYVKDDNGKLVHCPPTLAANESKLVHITHDEACFCWTKRNFSGSREDLLVCKGKDEGPAKWYHNSFVRAMAKCSLRISMPAKS
jgi:hypothetical protein